MLAECVRQTKVAYVAGVSFFADEATANCIRLNYSMSSIEQIDYGMSKLGAFFKKVCGE